MPHLTLEYSANLCRWRQYGTLCRKLAQCLRICATVTARFIRSAVSAYARCAATPTASPTAYPTPHSCMQDLNIAAGRSEEVKKATGDALFDIIKQHFAEVFDRQGLALSLELNEFSEAGTWKHNNLHARLQR